MNDTDKALLIVTLLLSLWLIGIIKGWKWACEWQYNSRLCFFDSCSERTRRLISAILVIIALIGCALMAVR